jgi:tight adherence protein C
LADRCGDHLADGQFQDLTMTLPIALLLGALALSALAAAAVVAMREAAAGAFRRRVTSRATASGPPAPTAPVAGVAPLMAGMLARWGESAGRGALGPETGGALRQRLTHAGFRNDRAPQILFGVRVGLAAGLGMAAIVASVAGRLSVTEGAGLVMLAANLGLFAPMLALRALVARRSQAMQDGLPDAIDLMVVAVEAGATVSAALQRVVFEFSALHAVVTEEFGLMLMEMQAGASRSHALARLGQRSASQEVRALTTLLIQSEAVGASIGKTLRVFAQEMRKNRYLEAERKAAELPVKMAFPLVFCIFPCLISLIFIPVGLSLMRTFFTS